MPKHNLSKEDLLELETENIFLEINPRKESEECGCEYCMREWKIAEENKLETKTGFKLEEPL